jgi:hypothetical protein
MCRTGGSLIIAGREKFHRRLKQIREIDGLHVEEIFARILYRAGLMLYHILTTLAIPPGIFAP